MVCSNCREKIAEHAQNCPNCGVAVSGTRRPVSAVVQDRGPAVVTLGVLAILILGPLSGVPGWVMANQDLNDIRAGMIQASASGTLRLGRGLNIIGTFFSPLWMFCFGIIAFVLAEMLFTFLAFL